MATIHCWHAFPFPSGLAFAQNHCIIPLFLVIASKLLWICQKISDPLSGCLFLCHIPDMPVLDSIIQHTAKCSLTSSSDSTKLKRPIENQQSLGTDGGSAEFLNLVRRNLWQHHDHILHIRAMDNALENLRDMVSWWFSNIRHWWSVPSSSIIS